MVGFIDHRAPPAQCRERFRVCEDDQPRPSLTQQGDLVACDDDIVAHDIRVSATRTQSSTCRSPSALSAANDSDAATAWPANGTYFAACLALSLTPTVFSSLMTNSRVTRRPIRALPHPIAAL